MRFFTVLCFASLITFGAHAESQSSKASVEKLMELTEVSKMMDAMQGQVSNMFSGMSKQMGITEKEKPAFDLYMKKVATLIEENMNWEAIKAPMIEIYMKHFTEEEVNGLIKFYQSDLGKSMTKKMPFIMQDSMMISQELMKEFMPKIQAIAIEMKQGIEKTRQGISAE